jgi:hypothetical protein
MSEFDDKTLTLNEEARSLIEQLPDHINEHIFRLAEEFHVPLWQFVCGLVLDSYQLGRLSAFQLDPAWKDGFRGGEYKCAQCGQAFKARRINQLYCCNECGVAAKLEADGYVRPTTPTTSVDVSSVVDFSGGGEPEPDDEDSVLGLLDTLAATGAGTGASGGRPVSSDPTAGTGKLDL